MNSSRWAVAALLLSGLAYAQDQSTPPVPISTNPADSPPRIRSGNVFASTDPGVPPAYGPETAKVRVLVFSDFQCPVCRRSADATQQLAEEFPGEVRLEFWQHALSSHASAENAAVAALAAQRQGKFWEFHDEVFRNQSALDPASLARYAERVGCELAEFHKDYTDPALRERVKAEGAFAETFGAMSTPAFMINGKVHVGWGSWAGFRSDVERELLAARSLEAQGVPVDQIAERRAEAQLDDSEKFAVYREQALGLKAEPPKTSGQAFAAPESSKKKKKKK